MDIPPGDPAKHQFELHAAAHDHPQRTDKRLWAFGHGADFAIATRQRERPRLGYLIGKRLLWSLSLRARMTCCISKCLNFPFLDRILR